jgi:hypothetical protein
MEPGYKTTEFWLVMAVVLIAFLTVTGVLTPERIASAASNTEKVFGLLQSILTGTGPLALLAGLVWAYIKRRTGLKEESIRARTRVLELNELQERRMAASAERARAMACKPAIEKKY